jgi:hypothetical protein
MPVDEVPPGETAAAGAGTASAGEGMPMMPGTGVGGAGSNANGTPTPSDSSGLLIPQAFPTALGPLGPAGAGVGGATGAAAGEGELSGLNPPPATRQLSTAAAAPTDAVAPAETAPAGTASAGAGMPMMPGIGAGAAMLAATTAAATAATSATGQETAAERRTELVPGRSGAQPVPPDDRVAVVPEAATVSDDLAWEMGGAASVATLAWLLGGPAGHDERDVAGATWATAGAETWGAVDAAGSAVSGVDDAGPAFATWRPGKPGGSAVGVAPLRRCSVANVANVTEEPEEAEEPEEVTEPAERTSADLLARESAQWDDWGEHAPAVVE